MNEISTRELAETDSDA